MIQVKKKVKKKKKKQREQNPCLVPDPRGKTLFFFKYDISCRVFISDLYQVEEFSFIFSLLKIFYH